MYYIRRELEEEICVKFVFVKSAVSIVLNLFCNVNDDTSTLSSNWLNFFKRESKDGKILI